MASFPLMIRIKFVTTTLMVTAALAVGV